MPYQNQQAGKGGHVDIVKNPDVAGFLSNCETVREPTDEEGAEIAQSFVDAPTHDSLPGKVVASDASPYVEPISGKFPSTQIGYIKLSFVLIDMADFNGLTSPQSRYVDPFKVAELHRNADAISFILPGSNIKYKGEPTVRDGFRLAVWEQMSDERTNFSGSQKYSAADTLLHICSGQVSVKRCPACGHQPDGEFVLTSVVPIVKCGDCDTPIYATDSLRLYEEVSDFGVNASPMTRFMNAIEHLAMAGLVRMLASQQPETLARMAFIVDGPLAIFGQPAWISKKLMAFYHGVQCSLSGKGLAPPVVLGLQKEGMAMEHARSVERFLRPGTFRMVDDSYRKSFISAGSSNSPNFGDETYYGQDFIFKTEKGQVFVGAVPYTFPNKQNKAEFASEKAKADNYPEIGKAFDLIRHFEFDLYRSAVVPIALAHRHASISLVPGGKVLDLVSRHGLGMGSR